MEGLGKQHGVKFLKAMQCLNIAQPLGQGLWEGVPLREVLKLVGKVSNIRRVYYEGFHNNDPKQLFQSSLGYNQVMETPPGTMPVFVAYRLNGRPISPVRGGPVRMVVPWAHGFKSIKWLQRITLTNDYKTNDTYAEQNNDPDSYLKTMARIDAFPESFKAGEPVVLRGVAVVGWSGLQRVEYWLRPDTGTHGELADGRSGLEDRGVAALSDRTAAARLGRQPSRRRDAQGRMGLRYPDWTAERLAAALQHRAAGR